MSQCVGTGALAVETAANTMAMILLLLLVSCSWFKSQVVVLTFYKHSVTKYKGHQCTNKRNLYAHNVLQRTGLGQNSPPKPHYHTVQTFEIVHQRWCPEKGLQLRHVLSFCYWAVLMGGARSRRVAARSPLAWSPVSRTLPCLWNFCKQLKCQLFAIF